jgi:hypothetical protein
MNWSVTFLVYFASMIVPIWQFVLACVASFAAGCVFAATVIVVARLTLEGHRAMQREKDDA